MNAAPQHLDQPVTGFIRRDFAQLRETMTTRQALETLRREGIGEKIVYFYVVDDERRLAGVIPTRRLLTAVPEQSLGELMIKRVVAIPQKATLLEACEFFVLHKFFAFPVVDEERRMIGILDVGVFTEEVFDVAERAQLEDVFETIGFQIAQVREAGPLKAFRYRFPWLLVSIGSGMACAVVASFFGETLAQSLVIAFFLSLVLQLGESVAMQAMTVTIQALRTRRPTLRSYARTLGRESATAFLLGAGCATIVTLIVWVWWKNFLPAITIGASILVSLTMAGLLGLSVPTVLHALRLDPKIAAGPVTLATTDVATLLFYFSIASVVLRGGE